jgi:hypothetical protein
MFIVSAVTRASGPAPPPKAPSVAAFAPLRIRTTALTATGAGSTEAPFSLKVTTQALAAQGLGTREPPFRPLVVKTDALTAQGRSAAPGGPK